MNLLIWYLVVWKKADAQTGGCGHEPQPPPCGRILHILIFYILYFIFIKAVNMCFEKIVNYSLRSQLSEVLGFCFVHNYLTF